MFSSEKRVKKLIKTSIKRNHRLLFVILGPDGAKTIPLLYQLMPIREGAGIVWCGKDPSDLSQKKINSQLKKSQSVDENVIAEILSKINYVSYSNIQETSGESCSFVVLQDPEAFAVNFRVPIFNSLQGGGVIIFLYPDVKNVEELNSLKLDEEHESARFCKRFALSLSSNSVILDDSMNILSWNIKHFVHRDDSENPPSEKEQIQELMQAHKDDAVLKKLIGLCRTFDQSQLLVKFMDALKKRQLHAIVSVSSLLGRGKSSALGLAIAGSLGLNYSNIFLSSSSPENVETVFKFLLMGLDALNYKEDKDYDIIQSVNPKLQDSLSGINIFRDHPQSVRFILPSDVGRKIDQAELVVVDEAASLPLQTLKQLTGPYVVLMASSVGLCATSSHLYNSVMTSLNPALTPSMALAQGDSFQKVTIHQPIHYSIHDPVEKWVNQVFCTDVEATPFTSVGYPEPELCKLFYVSRDLLFSGNSRSESFLRSLTTILSSSARIIYPNSLIELADSPNTHIFCLTPPLGSKSNDDTIICAVIVHLEDGIPNNIIHCGTNIEGQIPNCFNHWKISSKEHSNFIQIRGAHISNFVTHPSYRRMGYGLRTFELLQEFYEGKCISLDEKENDTSKMRQENSISDVLLQNLTKVEPEHVQYFVVSYSLTSERFRFWKKLGFIPVFSHELNSETEQVFFMVKSTEKEFESHLQKSWNNFRNYFFTLLNSGSRNLPSSLALNLLSTYSHVESKKELTKEEIDIIVRPNHMKCLEKYSQNLLDFHSIMHIVPSVTKLYFSNCFKDVALPRLQEVILLSLGLQYKTVDKISTELGLPNAQIHGLINRTIRKLTKYLSDILEKSIAKTLIKNTGIVMNPISQDLDEELEEAAKKIQQKQAIDAQLLKELDVSQYAIKGSEDDWETALLSGRKALVSIKSIKTTVDTEESPVSKQNTKYKNKHNQGKRKR